MKRKESAKEKMFSQKSCKIQDDNKLVKGIFHMFVHIGLTDMKKYQKSRKNGRNYNHHFHTVSTRKMMEGN